MYRAVFVDDEPWVLKSLTRFIDWNSFCIQVESSFTDPFAALESIRSDPPDVVFADIRMPGMSGLELCQQCREAGIDALFVIATAYADFQYARTAIEHQVFSYILKPFEKEQMLELAERLRKELDKRFLAEIYRSLRSCVLSSLTFGEDPENTLDAVSGDLLDLYDGHYVIAAVDSKEALQPDCDLPQVYCIPLYSTRYLLLAPDLEALRQMLASMPVGSYRAGLADRENCTLSASIRSSLKALYSVSFFALPEPVLLYRQPEPQQADAFAAAINEAITAQQWEQARRALAALEQRASRSGVLIDQMMQIYHAVLSHANSCYPKVLPADAFYPFQDFFQIYSIFSTASMLYEHMQAMIALLQDSSDGASTGSGDMEEVLHYVRRHFQDSLTLEFLSQHFHISLSHLCRQFKKAARMTFTEYLFSCRMEKAVALLAVTDLSIAEISEKVGYSDYFYFNKMFKKYTGCTPASYRKGRSST